MAKLNISIVIYRPDMRQLQSLLTEVQKVRCLNHIYLIDNYAPKPQQTDLVKNSDKITIIYPCKNIGYGAGHNIALRKTVSDNIEYHLVVNSDIELKSEDLDNLVLYMQSNTDVGSLMPKVIYPDGSLQYLCKLLPTPFDLFSRRFLPAGFTRQRTELFEMRRTGYNKIMNVPYLSGCFMLLSTSALKKVGLFDERFFMYPEDIDLTRRIHRHFLTIFYPDVTIVHHHKKASYKSIKMLLVHIMNICRYFNKWGWFSDKERAEVNRLTIKTYLC